MKPLLLALCVCTFGCKSAADHAGTVSPTLQFPTPAHGFTIPSAGPDGWTMERLVLEYGRASDQRFLFDSNVLTALKEASVPINAELMLTSSNMHSVVETFMVEAGFSFTVLREDDPRLIGVGTRETASGVVPLVQLAELDEWRAHPAYVVRTVLVLEFCDIEYVADSLKANLADLGQEQIIPLDSADSLLLQGPAPWVAELAGILLEVNERERLLSLPSEE